MTFSDVDAVDRVFEVDAHTIEGKMVECKKAVPKDSPVMVASASSAKVAKATAS